MEIGCALASIPEDYFHPVGVRLILQLVRRGNKFSMERKIKASFVGVGDRPGIRGTPETNKPTSVVGAPRSWSSYQLGVEAKHLHT